MKKKKYIHSGNFVAEVEVDLISSEDEWAPYLTLDDAQKLDQAREALQDKDLKKASQFGKVYRMEPIQP
ncbi:hypothetical protein [Gracilimonas mengyeensis]|uniref:Uncharacterized protein n=1 Tax=Gracilimonas mengyeensis TaxID=1302730 RepID=A0A521CH26_9BACT|nr:hypothetical protein [Gracilimonas mengyeensis]SMO58753.1 hypothetical protein SAMN06265219_105148 [Gracilimonas mengyeensis]